jgi:hypothetical protein
MLEEGCCKSDTRCGTAGSLSNGLFVTRKVSQIIESSTSSYQSDVTHNVTLRHGLMATSLMCICC